MDLILYGAGGHATSVADLAMSLDIKIKYMVDENSNVHWNSLGIRVKNCFDQEDLETSSNIAIAIGHNYQREQIFHKLISLNRLFHFPCLKHPSASVSKFAKIDFGTVVMAGGIVGPNVILGKFCIVNTNSSIDHDSSMGDFSSLAPASCTGGGVLIGRCSAIGMGAKIKHNTSVGNHSILGANSYCARNIADNMIYYGSPAKFVRTRNQNDPYL